VKNLIIKWLGLETVRADVNRLEEETYKVVEELVKGEVDNVKYDIQNDVKYELEDEFLSRDDVTSHVEEMLTDYELTELSQKVDDLDRKLDLLVAGYKLEVKLVKEDF
tara:strand:+ start:441 stop:764 length:324 start_codon:yes stop_codon:yes gene_type:complete